MDARGKVALITGAGTGIDRSCALKLSALGANVIMNYSRSEKEAREVVREVEALGAKAVALKADVADDREMRAMVERAIAAFGRLDILVNNAGRTHWRRVRDAL